jgi:hypothetical protein
VWELSTTNKQRISLIAMAKHGLPSLRWIHHNENFLMRQHTCYFEEHGNLIFFSPPLPPFSLSHFLEIHAALPKIKGVILIFLDLVLILFTAIFCF